LVIRTLNDGAKDAISPVYTGIFAAPSLSSQQALDAWTTTIDLLRTRGVISVLLRQSPFLPPIPDLPGLRSISGGRPTILLELTDTDSAWSGMIGRCRTAVRKALKNGYSGQVRQATDQDLRPGSDFRRLYEETMQRLDAAPGHYFSDAYYLELLEGLGPNLLVAEVQNQSGVVVSSTLVLRHAQRLHYYLTGSNRDDARMGANNLLIWTVAQYAIDQGLTQFHIGGGNSPDDSLLNFKRSFGGRELEYEVAGQIIDPDRYAAQTRQRAKQCHVSAETLLTASFFPAYRAGTVPAGTDQASTDQASTDQAGTVPAGTG
jgi:hypothetical protein